MVRNDLGMTPGKTASQAGHAYLGAYIQALQIRPHTAQAYSAEHPQSPGTKVCLQSDLVGLNQALDQAQTLGIPYFLVVDSGCENFFSGQPTITALGLGPAKKCEIKKITRRFQLLP